MTPSSPGPSASLQPRNCWIKPSSNKCELLGTFVHQKSLPKHSLCRYFLGSILFLITGKQVISKTELHKSLQVILRCLRKIVLGRGEATHETQQAAHKNCATLLQAMVRSRIFKTSGSGQGLLNNYQAYLVPQCLRPCFQCYSKVLPSLLRRVRNIKAVGEAQSYKPQDKETMKKASSAIARSIEVTQGVPQSCHPKI